MDVFFSHYAIHIHLFAANSVIETGLRASAGGQHPRSSASTYVEAFFQIGAIYRPNVNTELAIQNINRS